jgi:hypothetical protein
VLGKFRDLNRSAGGELTEVNRHAFGAELIQINGEVNRENETKDREYPAMAIARSRHFLSPHAKVYERERAVDKPDAAQTSARRPRDRPYVSRPKTWILIGLLLTAVGWIVFQFLVMLITLD